MNTLNPQQREAVRHISTPLLVIAGAGSGKTRVIAKKIAYLIQDCGYRSHSVVAVTFTNKAAKEMKQRVATQLSKEQLRGLNISTFHSLGLRLLKQEYSLAGLKKNFTVYDVQDSQGVVRNIVSSDNYDLPIERITAQISTWKNNLITPEMAASLQHDDPASALCANVYQHYNQQLRAFNALDFDDLISVPVYLLQQDPQLLEKWQNKIRYLLVDEYQDTNDCQYGLVRLLVGARPCLTVVGDDDQSIYAWRGAKPENLARMQNDFYALKVVKLEQNYRSTGCILESANHLISHNEHVYQKRLWSNLGFGDPIRVLQTKDDEHEAERVVMDIINTRFQKQAPYSDFAILYRGNHQSRVFEKRLRENQIPYYLKGGVSFFSFTEIKDLYAYLRLIVNDDDDHAFIRIINTPKREIGSKTLSKLVDYANSRQVSLCAASYELGLGQVVSERAQHRLRHFVEWLATFSDRAQRGEIKSLLADLIKEIDYAQWIESSSKDSAVAQRKMDNVAEFVTWYENLADKIENEQGVADILNQMMLSDILDQDDDDRGDRVCLMTLHSAKGLEFPRVYLVGMEEGLLPHATSVEEGQIDEERRLAYVGITRAQRILTISFASKRKRHGESMDREPSRFLSELPQESLRWEGGVQKVDAETRQRNGQAHLQNLRGLLLQGTDTAVSEHEPSVKETKIEADIH